MSASPLHLGYYMRTGVEVPSATSPDRVSTSSLGRWLPLFNGLLFAAASAVLLAWSLRQGDLAGTSFFALWFVGATIQTLYVLVHGVWQLVLDDTHLYWRSTLRTGRIALAEIITIERRTGLSRIHVIHADGNRQLAVLASPTFPILLDQLRAAAPFATEHVSADPGPIFGERPDGWSSLPRATGPR